MTDASIHTTSQEASFGDYFSLLKPRLMSLNVFTALVGLIVAPVSMHPFTAFVAILCIAVGAGAAGALNMWWDADIDSVMKRTQTRAIPSGRVAPGEALGIGATLSAFSVVLLYLATNALAAGILAFIIFFYAVIYTMWLKRTTPHNTVIGGLAGALPPLVGWTAATGSLAIEPLLMVALIFMWSPPHFWALALFVKLDYGMTKIPMLTETHGQRVTRNHILFYTLALIPFSVGLAFTPVGGWLYLVVAVATSLWFAQAAYKVWQRDQAVSEADSYAGERRLFKISLSYLFLHFGALLAERALATFGLGGW